MTIEDRETLQQTNPYPLEQQLVYAAHGIDGTTPLNPDEQEWIDAHTRIATQFSRINPDTGEYQIISPSRVAAITPITSRHLTLQRPARGILTIEEVLYAWRTNMPNNNGTRHPDELFDNAQRNFGSDEPTFHIERSIMRMELERRKLASRYAATARHILAQLRFRGDVPEDVVDAIIDQLR